MQAICWLDVLPDIVQHANCRRAVMGSTAIGRWYPKTPTLLAIRTPRSSEAESSTNNATPKGGGDAKNHAPGLLVKKRGNQD
jgi:hypothetical protein